MGLCQRLKLLVVYLSLELGMLSLQQQRRHFVMMGTTAFRMTPQQQQQQQRHQRRPSPSPLILQQSQPTHSLHSSNSSPEDVLSVKDVTTQARAYLHSRGASEIDVSVQHLLAHAMNLSWDDGFRQIRDLSIDRPVSLDEQHVFQTYLERRANHEPLQYILGQWDFLDYTLTIRSPLLCPRPETEELVLMVVNDIRTTTALARPRPARPCRILDVGCGTGAIGIALCALLPNVHVTAMDIEPVAVTTSNENARRILGETQNQYRAILCSATDFPPKNEDGDGEGLLLWDAVVSNPPYIPTLDMTDLDETVVNFESHEALCGGPDGLDVVRDIIAKLPTWCNPEAPCWMEVDPSHPRWLERWLGTSNSTDSTDGDHDQDVIFVSGHKDMFGLDRFVKLKVRS